MTWIDAATPSTLGSAWRRERTRTRQSTADARPALTVDTTHRTLDAATRARRNAIITNQVARETPWVMLTLALLIIVFDAGTAAAGAVGPVGGYISDAVQVAFFIVTVALCWGRFVPEEWTPWLFATAIVVSVAALSYKHVVDPTGNAVGVILMTTVLFGGLLAMWRPFLLSASIIVPVVSVMLFRHDPSAAVPWIITLLTGIGASAALLFARRRSTTQLAIAQRAIEGMATHDQATGLLNRYGLLSAADNLVCMAKRDGQTIFAVFVDVVGLKAVNDEHGHGTGDLVITRCAEAVMRASRDCDLVARWGGDEFVVIGKGPLPDRGAYARRITMVLDVSGLEDKWAGCVSVGAAQCHDSEVLSVIDGADSDMYTSRPSCRRRTS